MYDDNNCHGFHFLLMLTIYFINLSTSVLYLHSNLSSYFPTFFLKGNAQFFQKVTFEPLMDFKQNHYGSWKYYKNCYL